MSNGPTLTGYLELLIKVLVSTVLLIFMGVGCAIMVLAAPFLLSLMLVVALTAGGVFVFSWEYVWIGMILIMVMIGVSIE